MKPLLYLLALTIGTAGCTKNNDDTEWLESSPRTDVPEELIAPNGGYWTIGTISSINFWDAQSSEYRNAGGIVSFFKFNKNGTYKYLLYVNASDAYTRNQTWTEVEGTAVIGEKPLSNGQTYKTVTLHPVKGTDRVLTNAQNSTRALSQQELKTLGNLAGTFACARYESGGRQYLDILDLSNNFLSSFHEEW